MEEVNQAATGARILSASCCLSTEFSLDPQEVNPYSNVVMYFDAYCRHIRQKNFSIARFPIFFPGGLGTLEEVGIEMVNAKLGIHDRAPYIFIGKDYWEKLRSWMDRAVENGMVEESMIEHVHMVDRLSEALPVYEQFLSGETEGASRSTP